MKMKYFLSILLFVFFGFSCKKKEFKGDGKTFSKSFKVDGIKRDYLIYIPKNYDSNQTYPLILALHGRLGDGKNAEKMMKFNQLADEKKMIIVYPDGYKKSWNDGRGIGPAAEANINDVNFIDKLIDKVSNDYSINTKKVYSVGMSNGGFMTLSLACHLSNKITAYASVTGSMNINPEEWCFPTRKVPVLLLAGTDDPLVPYEGGEMSSGGYCSSFNKVLEFWISNNNCDLALKDSVYINQVLDDGTELNIISYKFCENESEVILYKIVGGGHTWPGGNQYLSEDKIGKMSREIYAEKVIVDFFLSHEMD